MNSGLNQSSVDDINQALRLYRRLLFRIFAIVVVGFAAVLGLGWLGTYMSPPYGVYIFGESLSTWGLLLLLALLIAEVYWEGRQIGQALNDPMLMAAPISTVTSGLSVVARRANAMGMEWSGFLGPLRPARTKR